MTTLTTVAGSDEVDPCPSRKVASGEREITGTALGVRVWSRGECGTEWAFPVANPARRYLDYLSAGVEFAAARAALREIITVADQAPMLTGQRSWCRLLALAGCAALRPIAAPRFPIGRWLSEVSDSVSGGRSVPDPAEARLATGRTPEFLVASRYHLWRRPLCQICRSREEDSQG